MNIKSLYYGVTGENPDAYMDYFTQMNFKTIHKNPGVLKEGITE